MGRTWGSRLRLASLLPGLAVLQGYQSAWLRVDLLAGLTVGAMLIPQSMAYAALAGLPPEYGFYAVIGPLVVYALVGTSRHLGVGPEPGTAVLAAAGVSSIAAQDGDRYVALMAGLALLVAGICVVGAMARLGFLASLLSKPVLIGYITGVGLTLFSSQLAGLTGAPIDSDMLLPRLHELLAEVDQVRLRTLALGLATLVVMVGLRRAAPRLPGALIAVVTATAVSASFDLPRHGVAIVGAIPGGLPVPGFPDVSLADLGMLLPVAAGIALVGYTDNVLTARSVAARHGYRVDPNQELLALGLTNLSAGLSQGFPISSSASRTAVPASLGSRTQLVSIVASAFVVATLLGLRPLLSEIPKAALAAVIIAAAITIIDVAGIRALWRTGRDEALLALATAFGVIVFGVLTGVLVAVVLSVLMALYRMARPHDAVLGDYPALDGWVEVDAHATAETEPGLVVYRFDAPLFFLNAERFRERVEQVLTDNPGEEAWIVLDFEGVGSLDATALDTLAELVDELAGHRVEVVAVARANTTVTRRLLRAGLLEPEGHLRSFPTINGAVAAYRGRHEGGPVPLG